MKAFNKFPLFLALAATSACSFHARAPEQYRDDTKALLESQSGTIKQCYDDILKGDKTVSGTVTVRFTVQEETGKIVDAAIDTARTTAPEPLAQCVVKSITGLALTPPDEREGHATFVYEFHVNSPEAAAAPPPT